LCRRFADIDEDEKKFAGRRGKDGEEKHDEGKDPGSVGNDGKQGWNVLGSCSPQKIQIFQKKENRDVNKRTEENGKRSDPSPLKV